MLCLETSKCYCLWFKALKSFFSLMIVALGLILFMALIAWGYAGEVLKSEHTAVRNFIYAILPNKTREKCLWWSAVHEWQQSNPIYISLMTSQWMWDKNKTNWSGYWETASSHLKSPPGFCEWWILVKLRFPPSLHIISSLSATCYKYFIWTNRWPEMEGSVFIHSCWW